MHLLILAGLLLLAADDDKVVVPTADEVARLVRQLDAGELAERDQAERKLLDFGFAVLPLLPPVDDRMPAEARLRLSRVQQKLLRDQANAAALASKVTLHGTKMPIADAFAEITKQTKNPVVDYRREFGQDDAARAVDIDAEQAPYWQVMDKLLDDARMTLYPFAGRRGAFAVNRADGNKPRSQAATYSGPFRVEPVRVESVRGLRDGQESLKLYIEVAWEPRLQPFAIIMPVADIKALDNAGGAISVVNVDAEPEASIREGMAAVELEIPLSLPPRSATSIASLQGKLLALVPGELQEFRFKTPPITARNAQPKKVEMRNAGATVIIDQVRKNNDAWEVALRVKYDVPSAAMESHRSWILDNEAYFVDAKGEKAEPGGYEQTRQTKDEIGVSYFFDLDQAPDKLDFVYRTPVTVLEVPVELKLQDMRLP